MDQVVKGISPPLGLPYLPRLGRTRGDQPHHLLALPQPVDVAKRQRLEGARRGDLHHHHHLRVRVDGSLVGAGHRLAVGREGKVPHLVRELLALRVEVQVDPVNVMLGGVRVRDLLADADLHLEGHTCLHHRRGFDHRHVFLFFPIVLLDEHALLLE